MITAACPAVTLFFALRMSTCPCQTFSNNSLLLQELVLVAPVYTGRFIPDLVKVMRRIAEDHSQNKGLVLGPIRAPSQDPK